MVEPAEPPTETQPSALPSHLPAAIHRQSRVKARTRGHAQASTGIDLTAAISKLQDKPATFPLLPDSLEETKQLLRKTQAETKKIAKESYLHRREAQLEQQAQVSFQGKGDLAKALQ